jgi:pimeloyl-ACP methyl ester carboxylesterase
MLLAAAVMMVSAGAAEPIDRTRAAGYVADITKIVSPNGIDKLEPVEINGTKQWISIRGRDRNNPILLFIHGGPAAPEIPLRWTFQSGWEDYFTVVQWDQRGSGKTYLANDPQKIAPTMTSARMFDDAVALVRYLRTTYHRDKIFVVGHSWGTTLGLSLAKHHPEWLYAYIGMGQIVDMREGERQGYAWTLAAARERGNTEAVKELQAIAPYPEADGSLPLAKIGTERKWNLRFGGLAFGRSSYDVFENAEKLSPEYSDAELAGIDQGSGFTLPKLLPELAKFDYSRETDFSCPIFMFEGRHDTTTPSSVVAAWFEKVRAPAKKFVWFENASHMVHIEEPGRVLVHLVGDALPLAGEGKR